VALTGGPSNAPRCGQGSWEANVDSTLGRKEPPGEVVTEPDDHGLRSRGTG
jgi:hypothetical protein